MEQIIDGIWKEYKGQTKEEKENSKIPEYIRLYNDLKNTNVNWRVAKKKYHAESELKQFGSHRKVKKYIFYQKDNFGNYSIPKINISINGINRLRVIGTNEENCLEEGFEDIAMKKIEEIANDEIKNKEQLNEYLNEKKEDIEVEKKINNITRKMRLNQELDESDYNFFLDVFHLTDTSNSIIDLNGQQQRTLNLIKKLFQDKNEKIKEFIDANFLVEKDWTFIKYLPKEFTKDRTVAAKALINSIYALDYIDESLLEDSWIEYIIKLKKDYYEAHFLLNEEETKEKEYLISWINNRIINKDRLKKERTKLCRVLERVYANN